MSASELAAPAALRVLQPLLKTSVEIESNPGEMMMKLGYYCRLAALIKGSELIEKVSPAEKPSCEAFLTTLIGRVEQEKVDRNYSTSDEAADRELISKFGLTLFASADKEDRSGTWTKDTIKTYLRASTILDAVRIIGSTDEKLSKISLACKSRVQSLTNDLKAGIRTPYPFSAEELASDPTLLDSLKNIPSVSEAGFGPVAYEGVVNVLHPDRTGSVSSRASGETEEPVDNLHPLPLPSLNNAMKSEAIYTQPSPSNLLSPLHTIAPPSFQSVAPVPYNPHPPSVAVTQPTLPPQAYNSGVYIPTPLPGQSPTPGFSYSPQFAPPGAGAFPYPQAVPAPVSAPSYSVHEPHRGEWRDAEEFVAFAAKAIKERNPQRAVELLQNAIKQLSLL